MNQVHPLNHRVIELKHSVCKVEDHVYDFEIMIWNHVSDSGICHRVRLGEQIGEQILPWGSLCERTPLGKGFGEFSSS